MSGLERQGAPPALAARHPQAQLLPPKPPRGEAPLAQAVTDALQHVLRAAEVMDEEAGWGQHGPVGRVASEGPGGDGGGDRDAGDATDDALPPQAALRLYKARVQALQSDVATLQAQAKDKAQRLDAVERELRALQGEKAAWLKQQKALEAQAEKLRRAAEEARARAQEREEALKELGRDRQASQQERKQAEAEMKARDARLSHALGELERYRKLLDAAKEQRAAGGEVSREEHNRVVADNRRLEQQKAELAAAFRKAMKLVDVLKRQKLHLEAACLLDVSGRELLAAMELGK